MDLKARFADNTGDGEEVDGARFQLGFEGLANALATPVNGGNARLACVVDEHDGLLDGFALTVIVRLFREIFLCASNECASILIPTEKGFS